MSDTSSHSDTELKKLIDSSPSMQPQEKDGWLKLLETMNDAQKDELKTILVTEKEKLEKIDDTYRKKVGTIQNCLIYGQSKRDPGQLQGRTICNRVVNFPSNNIDLVGQLINIRINDALPNCLRGSIQN